MNTERQYVVTSAWSLAWRIVLWQIAIGLAAWIVLVGLAVVIISAA